MKKLIILLFTFFTIINKAQAVGTVVMDTGTHSRIDDANRKLDTQNSTLLDNQDVLLDIKDLFSGNAQQSNLLLSNQTFSADLTKIKIPHLNKQYKIKEITKDLDNLFEGKTHKIEKEEKPRYFRERQRQAEIKQTLIYANKIINQSKFRQREIETLAVESDQKGTPKDSMDFQSRLLIEVLFELKKNNELIAMQLRNQAKKEYKGLVKLKISNNINN